MPFILQADSGFPLKTIDSDAGDQTRLLLTATNLFGAPPGTDSGTVTYTDSVTEVYAFRSGGISGTILRTLTLVYTDATKARLASWSAS